MVKPKDPSDQDELLVPEDDPDDVKHEEAKSPAVAGEEDAFSGDMPAESPDIDAELEKLGLRGDVDGVRPLGVDEEIQE